MKEKVPAFIITLGGLLVFRGLQWLVIHDGTVPVVRGGETNLYSLLTTYYFSPRVGLVAAGVLIVAMAGFSVVGFRRRKAAGEAGDGELTFMRVFVAAQLILLFVLVSTLTAVCR